MTKRDAEELIEIEIDGTEKQECTEERNFLDTKRSFKVKQDANNFELSDPE